MNFILERNCLKINLKRYIAKSISRKDKKMRLEMIFLNQSRHIFCALFFGRPVLQQPLKKHTNLKITIKTFFKLISVIACILNPVRKSHVQKKYSSNYREYNCNYYKNRINVKSFIKFNIKYNTGDYVDQRN